MLKSNIYKIAISLLTLLSVLLSGCQSQHDPKQIYIGTISGPETELMKTVAKVAERDAGLRLKIIEFSDYNLPNAALNDGSLDANLFQHQSYLTEEIHNKHYHLTPLAKVFIYPMGIYSNKIKHLTELKQHAIIAIPNDPSNEARALLLLNKAGLITLTRRQGTAITPQTILSNPKQLQIKELDAAQLTRVLDDVDCAVINSNYAILAHLYTQQALVSEDKNSWYANLLVVRSEDKNNPKFIGLIKALHSPEVIANAEKLFQGEAIPAWK